MRAVLFLFFALLCLRPAPATPQGYSGSVWLLTTPEGANLPAGTVLRDFPVLIRLRADSFPFAQAQPHGEDLRVTDSAGQPLALQIEAWDAAKGEASVWVRVPEIQGNRRQELRLHWGDPTAKSVSSSAAVFNESNGYIGVWHLEEMLGEATGKGPLTNKGTTATPGVIGLARHFAGEQGLAGGESLTYLPTGSAPHSSQAWFRAEKPNGTLLGWGNEQGQGKVTMQYRSPAQINLDCYFSDANVASGGKLPQGEWVHVVHTYERGRTRLYVNGALVGSNNSTSSPLNVKSPAKLWIGGWYNNYNYWGDIDEVRISRVARSADWVRLEYENQKPLHTLVGPLVQAGDSFALTAESRTVREGDKATLTAQAGGALKLYWLVDGKLVAVDQLSYTLEAGRVQGDQTRTVALKAVYPEGVREKTAMVTVKEAIADPTVRLTAPRRWDGRAPLTLTATASPSLRPLRFRWQVAGLATIHTTDGPTLRLERAQNSGTLTVRVAVDNGGASNEQAVTLAVREPKTDPWVARPYDDTEQPSDGQFYPRLGTGQGELVYRGQLSTPVTAVIARVWAEDKPYRTLRQTLPATRRYALTVPLQPGLVHYRATLSAVTATGEQVLHTASDLVCGDAYVIQGQSNAVATDFGRDEPPPTSEWIRTFTNRWERARHRNSDGTTGEIGYWGMELARRLVAAEEMPICILNGAVGGTRIDQHQRNPANPTDPETIYGRLLQRARQARLTHGIRGLLWHQGENDQGADGPTGGYGWETYEAFFIALSAAWKQDFPNLQHYYLFQIWPKSCAMGIDGSDNRLREVQRRLPALFSHMAAVTTLGIEPPGGCHFPAAGYAEFARLSFPLVERGNYGKRFTRPITPPNLERVALAPGRTELTLTFDQPVLWEPTLASEFLLDGQRGQVVAGRTVGTQLILTLAAPTTAKTITYLDSAAWSQKRLLRGANGLAAFTFCEVPLGR